MAFTQWSCGRLACMGRAALITAVLTSCTAQVGIGGESSRSAGATTQPRAADPASGGAPGQGGTGDPGPAPIRRLTRSEYNRTVHDLLGDETKPAEGFIPEEMSLGFNNNANALSVSPILAEQYVSAAESLAARAAQSPESLMRCGAGGVDDACVERFIRDFTRFAFRRPLPDSELQRHLSAYSVAKANLDLRGALEVVIGSVLLSPRFLYRAGAVSADRSVSQVRQRQLLENSPRNNWGNRVANATRETRLRTPPTSSPTRHLMPRISTGFEDA